MIQSHVEEFVLRELYISFFAELTSIAMEDLRKPTDCDPNTFVRVLDRLCDTGLIRVWTAGPTYRMTVPGVLRTEELSLGPTDMMATNSSIRTMIMTELAAAYDNQGALGFIHKNDFFDRPGTDKHQVLANTRVLQETDWVIFTGLMYQISPRGYQAVEDWRRRRAIVAEYERIFTMVPQPRGRALQPLFARIATEDGWSQEEGVRTAEEEIDVFLYKGDKFYLVECKWEKNAIGPSVIGWLQAKLRKRAGSRGVVVSMSGFTEAAAKTASEAMTDSLMVFFGPRDFEAMIYDQMPFTQLLETKLQELVIRRKILWS